MSLGVSEAGSDEAASYNIAGQSSELIGPTDMEITESETVPPCAVCWDKGSGFHYGVYSCEGCKVFSTRLCIFYRLA